MPKTPWVTLEVDVLDETGNVVSTTEKQFPGKASVVNLMIGKGWRRKVEAPAELVEEVPPGSVEEVLTWVGDDPSRAMAALTAEQAGAQRKSLVPKLQAIVHAANAPAADGEATINEESTDV